MSFRLEYKRGSTAPSMFQRQVRMQVDLSQVSKSEAHNECLYAITFTLISGKNHQANNVRRKFNFNGLGISFSSIKNSKSVFSGRERLTNQRNHNIQCAVLFSCISMAFGYLLLFEPMRMNS